MNRNKTNESITSTFHSVTRSLEKTMSAIHASMNSRIADIAKAREELREDTKLLNDICINTRILAQDLTDMANDMDAVCVEADSLYDDTRTLSTKLKDYGERDEIQVSL